MQGKPAASFHDCISLDHVVPFIFDDLFDCERLEVAFQCPLPAHFTHPQPTTAVSIAAIRFLISRWLNTRS